MRKIFLVVTAIGLLASHADAATLALPGVVFTSAPSTSIACTETAASNLVVPVAAGTVIFSCTVAPSTWTGTVSLSGGSPFTLTAPVGNAFNVTLSAAVTAPATDQPGTLTTSP
jgi:hypothetical protein